MTLLERPTEAPVRMECLHDSRGVCWACSDQDPRWRAWRVAMGLGEEPPNAYVAAARERARRISKTHEDWRDWYARKYQKGA